jgi:primosomal replication protein N
MNQCNNQAVLQGVVVEPPVLSHKVHGIQFFRFSMCVLRLSGREDILNVLAPAPLLELCPIEPDLHIEVTGEIRSFNNRSGVGNRLLITLFARTLTQIEESYCNQVYLSGVICKPPILRRTPLGRDICDLLLAVNRKYRRADYLPCIAWGSLAAYCAQLKVGNPIIIEGRLQSRLYLKNIDDQSLEYTAFEISIMSLDTPIDT